MAPKCIVVGAGISGLIAARKLKKLDWQVTVLEKSKGYGGRMATRRIGEAVFDHGLQHLTSHGMFFRSLLERFEDEGLVKDWCRGFLNSDRLLSSDGYLRRYAPKGMNSLAKFLAQEVDLDVRLQEKVTLLTQLAAGWRVQCDSGLSLEADALILTAPLPQSLQLLKKSENSSFDSDLLARLKEFKYDPCITVMAILDGPSGLAEPGAMFNTDPMTPVRWICDNHQKGLSPVESVTIHSTAHFARQNWKIPREEAGQKLWDAAQHFLAAGRVEMQSHGWRFAQIKEAQEEDYLFVNEAPPLVLAGDSFGHFHHQLEGAAVSGLEAGKALGKKLN